MKKCWTKNESKKMKQTWLEIEKCLETTYQCEWTAAVWKKKRNCEKKVYTLVTFLWTLKSQRKSAAATHIQIHVKKQDGTKSNAVTF